MFRSLIKPSPAFVLAFVALLFAIGGTAVALPRATTSAAPNVKGVTDTVTVSNGQTGLAKATCPAGYQVFGGGYSGTGRHTMITVAAPTRGNRSYTLNAYEPPKNIYAGILDETATVKIVAFCAPIGKPLVME
jgi:hypothetical protein